jgi:hypothetical protein
MHRRELTHAERMEIIERHQQGHSLRQIAAELSLNYYTVRKWWRIYHSKGASGLLAIRRGPPATGILGRSHPLVKYVALRLKRQHRGWGVDKVLLELKRRPSLQGQRLPKRSALAAYLAQFKNRLLRPRRLPTKRPKPVALTGKAPHACWQIDFKGGEQVVGSNLVIAPFMVCDEASGAPLAGFIHPIKSKGDRTGLTTRLVQQDLRRVFTQWGLPDAVRMDRDPLLVGSARLEWPGLLLLWLIGLNIVPIRRTQPLVVGTACVRRAD